MYCNCTVKLCLLEVKIYVVHVYQEVCPPRKIFSLQEIIKHLNFSKKETVFYLIYVSGKIQANERQIIFFGTQYYAVDRV